MSKLSKLSPKETQRFFIRDRLIPISNNVKAKQATGGLTRLLLSPKTPGNTGRTTGLEQFTDQPYIVPASPLDAASSFFISSTNHRPSTDKVINAIISFPHPAIYDRRRLGVLYSPAAERKSNTAVGVYAKQGLHSLAVTYTKHCHCST